VDNLPTEGKMEAQLGGLHYAKTPVSSGIRSVRVPHKKGSRRHPAGRKEAGGSHGGFACKGKLIVFTLTPYRGRRPSEEKSLVLEKKRKKARVAGTKKKGKRIITGPILKIGGCCCNTFAFRKNADLGGRRGKAVTSQERSLAEVRQKRRPAPKEGGVLQKKAGDRVL